MEKFEMVAKTMMGLEEVLAEELRNMGAESVEPGRRMVSFVGDKQMLYKANLCCRTALRILKPFYKFEASNPDELYDRLKEYDWEQILDTDHTFCIDTVAYSDDFTHTQFATYKAKDAIVDWFRDKYDRRPGVRLKDADIMINMHISGTQVTMSLDSSGESLHKRGYRVAQTEAPINEVLAAGIILLSGWRGETPFVDPMCGSGTFLIEAALIAANINPGIYRKSFAFEQWPDFDRELFDSLYNDDSAEREAPCKIYGADMSAAAIAVAEQNVKSAGVSRYVDLQVKPLSTWEQAPQPAGVLVTNPPYGERIKSDDMEGLYSLIGNRLKNVFKGYHAWVIGYRDEYFQKIGLAPSMKVPVLNGSLECELREYVIFEGDKKSFRANGGSIKPERRDDDRRPARKDGERRFDRKDGERRFDRKEGERRFDRKEGERRFDRKEGERRFDRKEGERRFDRKDEDRRNPENRFTRKDFRKDAPTRTEGGEQRRERAPRDGAKDFGPRQPRFGRREEPQEEPQVRRSVFEGPLTPEQQEIIDLEKKLAKRRNPDIMKSIENRKPQLPPSDKPMMRSRGWRKKDNDNE